MTGREVRLRRDACTFGKFRNWYFAQKDFKKSFKNIKRRGKIFPFLIWNLVSESTNEDISASRAATHFHSLAFNNLIFRMSDYGRLYSIYWSPSIRDWVLRSGMLFYLHHINSKIFFHPAKFDNFKDEKISSFKTVSVSPSKNLLVWKLVV